MLALVGDDALVEHGGEAGSERFFQGVGRDPQRGLVAARERGAFEVFLRRRGAYGERALSRGARGGTPRKRALRGVQPAERLVEFAALRIGEGQAGAGRLDRIACRAGVVRGAIEERLPGGVGTHLVKPRPEEIDIEYEAGGHVETRRGRLDQRTRLAPDRAQRGCVGDAEWSGS